MRTILILVLAVPAWAQGPNVAITRGKEEIRLSCIRGCEVTRTRNGLELFNVKIPRSEALVALNEFFQKAQKSAPTPAKENVLLAWEVSDGERSRIGAIAKDHPESPDLAAILLLEMRLSTRGL